MNQSIKDENEPLEPEHEEIVEENPVVEPSELEKMTAELGECKDRFLRLAAEFENFKKISTRERLQATKFANENLVVELLPVLDNLEQAVKAGKGAGAAGAQDLIVGVDMVLKQLMDTLVKFGVEFFSSEGLPFDPSRHEALCEQEVDDVEPGIVVQEYQKGCLLHGRLLRAARVAVAKSTSK